MYSRLIVFAVLVFGVHCYDDWVYKTIRDAEAKNEAVDECGICTKLTESFAKVSTNRLEIERAALKTNSCPSTR